MLSAIIYFGCALLVTTAVATTVKTWSPNTNFWNPDNWNLKRVPCRYDKVVFPPYSDVSVALQPGTTALQELILPFNGELVLAEGQLLVTGQFGSSSAGCPGQELLFTGGEERAWLDTTNWRSEFGNEWPGGAQSAVPHIERVPCPTDKVVFPIGSTYKVTLPSVPVTVSSLYINDQSTSTDYFRSMVLRSDTGYRMFRGDANRIYVTGEGCKDRLGCVCNEHQFSEAMEALCAVEKPRCPPSPSCEDPIQPAGHCCQICGAQLSLEMDLQRFSQSAVISNVRSNYPDLLAHLSRSDYYHSQLVLRDKEPYKGQSTRIAQKIAEDLKNDERFGVRSVKLVAAGEPLGSLGSTSSIILVTLLVILAILAVGFLVVSYQRYTSAGAIFPSVEIPSFHFRRFENRSVSVDGEVEIATPAITSQKSTSDGAKAFDNPLFDKPSTSSSASLPRGLLARPKVTGSSTTVENPTYKALQASAQQDLMDMEDIEEEVEEVTPVASDKYTTLHEEE